VSAVSVTVNITHAYDADLALTLNRTHRQDSRARHEPRSSGVNFTKYRVHDSATLAIAAGSAPFTGNYKPEAVLSGFTG